MVTERPLNDATMQHYLTEGYVTVQTNFPKAFHQTIYDQANAIFESERNPGNDIYPRIPELIDVLNHPRVQGALTAILGPRYMLHPHRHCHLTPPGKDPQRNHKDSYEDDANVRHHRSRWAMAFYYPQDVDDEIGPTAVTPGSQYFTEAESLDDLVEKRLCGPAGTVTIVHYDVWHRACENRTDRNRFMMKFLFCRMHEPLAPAWDTIAPLNIRFDRHGNICPHLWRWNAGRTEPVKAGLHDGHVSRLKAQYSTTPESDRLNVCYMLGEAGAVDTLMDLLARDTKALLDANLEKSHTNASQVDASYGLTTAGVAAVPALTDALTDASWWMRAAAADILGDIGRPSVSSIPALTRALDDDCEWVRRNATEALGTLTAENALPALANALGDESDRVRHNAALSLIKIGEPTKRVGNELRHALEDENRYVRALSQLALDRLIQ